jgi:hypothetical protein
MQKLSHHHNESQLPPAFWDKLIKGLDENSSASVWCKQTFVHTAIGKEDTAVIMPSQTTRTQKSRKSLKQARDNDPVDEGLNNQNRKDPQHPPKPKRRSKRLRSTTTDIKASPALTAAKVLSTPVDNRPISAPAPAPSPALASAPASVSGSSSASVFGLPSICLYSRSRGRNLKIGLINLPVEVLDAIIDYIIPKNWKYYFDREQILNLRLICSK